MRIGFVGGSYQPQSPLADAELSINFYPERVESPNGRTAGLLLPTPGLAVFALLKAGLPSTRGSCVVSGRQFFVAGTHLFEVSGAGVVTDYGAAGGNNFMIDDGLPVTMIPGGTQGGLYPGQIAIASGGTLTVFSLAGNVFLPITAAPNNILVLEYLDGFFVALQSTNDFQVSNPEDATTWSGLSISQVSVFSDQLLGMIATNRLLWIFGAKRAVAYYNAGLPIFPFAVANGGFMEVGILAQFSVARVATTSGTTVMWLGGDERGGNTVYAANGFTPLRVSDHGLEYWLTQQANITDAVGFSTQEVGHNFYWLWFPSANATWRLDADSGIWHRLQSTVGKLNYQAHLARCHSFNFGMHLVGDRNSGTVYSMSQKYLTEMTGVGINTPIIRTRIGPTVANESTQNPIPINEFQIDFELGLGPEPPLTQADGKTPRDPYAVLSYSQDFGKTWGPDRFIPVGQAGNFLASAIDRRLGSWRSFTPKLTVSDPIPWRIVDAYVNGTQDPSPRLSKSLAKIT